MLLSKSNFTGTFIFYSNMSIASSSLLEMNSSDLVIASVLDILSLLASFRFSELCLSVLFVTIEIAFVDSIK